MTAAPRWHRGLRVLLLVPVLGLALVTAPMAGAALGTSASRSTARVAGFDTSRVTVRVGGAVWSSITVLPRAARTVTVQYRRAGAARFVTASSGRSSAQGAYDAELMPPSAGVWQFRVVLPATAQARTIVSSTRVVVAAGSAAVTRVRGYDSSARTIVLGEAVADTVSLRPKAPRTVCVQARGPGARDFVTVSVGRAGSAGGFRAVYRPATAGVWAYRLLVRAGATARRVVTPARLLTVSAPTSTTPGATPPVTQTPPATPTDSTPPGPVTGLVVASSSSAAVHLSWSNPADGDFAGVMVRRSQGSTAPASTTDGALVVTTTKSATTYVDTGLASSTAYAYSLFALDTAGNVSARAVGTATTGAPTVAVLEVNGSTGPTAKETRNNSQAYDIAGSHAALGQILVLGTLDYGDGSPAVHLNGDPALWDLPAHAYADLGHKTVTWTVTDSAGATVSTHIDIDVLPEPTATIAPSVPGLVPAHAPITFNVTSSLAGASATSYDFFSTKLDSSLVAGSVFAVPGPPAPGALTLTFDTPGSYQVELDVLTDAGGEATATTTVTVL